MILPLKQFLMDEAEKLSKATGKPVSVSCITMRLKRGYYPNVKIIRHNKRVVYVEVL